MHGRPEDERRRLMTRQKSEIRVVLEAGETQAHPRGARMVKARRTMDRFR